MHARNGSQPPSWDPIPGIWKPVTLGRSRPAGAVPPPSRVRVRAVAESSSKATSQRKKVLREASLSTTESRQGLIDGAYAAATSKQNRSAWNLYEASARAAGKSSTPVTGTSLVRFIEGMVAGSYKYSTVVRYVKQVEKVADKTTGAELPTRDRQDVDLALRSARKLLGDPGPMRAATLTVQQVVEAAGRLPPVEASCFLLGVHGLFRLSELLHLRACSISPTSSGITVFVERSKTDQWSGGRLVHINCVLSPPGDRSAAAQAARALCDRPECAAHRVLERALLSPSPEDLLFPVDRHHFAEDLRTAVVTVTGCPPERATTHLMRRSGATIYFRGGVPLTTIGEIGRWKGVDSLNNAYLRDASDFGPHSADLMAQTWSRALHQ